MKTAKHTTTRRANTKRTTRTRRTKRTNRVRPITLPPAPPPIAERIRVGGYSFGPNRFRFELARTHGVFANAGFLDVSRDEAMVLAMEIISCSGVEPMGSLREEERAFLRYVVASDTLVMRQGEPYRRWRAGKISDAEYKRLDREVRKQIDPCWPTETYDEVRKAMVPMVKRRDAYEERTAPERAAARATMFGEAAAR